MRAVVLDAKWQPRPEAKLAAADIARRWAPNANLVWRDPQIEVREVPAPSEPGPGEVFLPHGG